MLLLNFDRAASQFEALRLETEASGKRPKAFMLTIGNLAMRQARAQYSCNFLACADMKVNPIILVLKRLKQAWKQRWLPKLILWCFAQAMTNMQSTLFRPSGP